MGSEVSAGEPADRESVLAEIRRLDAAAQQLGDARGELEHERRRASDALERAGGRSRAQERRLDELRSARQLGSLRALDRAEAEYVAANEVTHLGAETTADELRARIEGAGFGQVYVHLDGAVSNG